MNDSEQHPVRKLARGIYQVWIPLSQTPFVNLDHMNAYIIEGDQGWWLLDTGWNDPFTFQALEKGLNLLTLNSLISGRF